MKLTLIDKKQETDGVITFVFKSEKSLVWRAGQFLVYTLPHENQDNRKNERYFTISSAPFENNPQITTRLTSQNGSSFKNALVNLQIGDTIETGEPDGDFIVDDPNKELIFIAGGIGITAFRSILADLNHRNLPVNVTLLYANRDNNFVFKNELESIAQHNLNFKIHYFIEPNRINETSIKELVPDLQKPAFYVSGPEPMVEAFEKMLITMGIKDENIKRDYFPGYDWP